MSRRVEPFMEANGMELDPLDQNAVSMEGGQSRNNFLLDLPSHQPSIEGHRASARPRRRSLRPKTANEAESQGQDMAVVDVNADEEDGEQPLSLPKSLPAPMKEKRQFRKSIKRPEAKKISNWRTFKLRTAMFWSHTTSSISAGIHDVELWKGHLKEVEGQFGNGVLSYFIFLKWLMFLNFFIFIMGLSFLTIPNRVLPAPAQQQDVNGTCSFNIPDYTAGQNVADMFLDFFTGEGWINTTLMFYSNYAYEPLKKGSVTYDMPLAYLLVGGSYFFCSFFLMIRK